MLTDPAQRGFAENSDLCKKVVTNFITDHFQLPYQRHTASRLNYFTIYVNIKALHHDLPLHLHQAS